METLSKQQQYETSKSFDILSSVKLLRHDLQAVGYVQPETRQRVYDEELSLIAEGINRPLRTEFNLKREDGELVYFHNGKWRPYLATLTNGVEVYVREAMEDPRKQFMAERAAKDLQAGYGMLRLRPGEKMRWYSAYPESEVINYGAEYLYSLGFQPERQMGFLYEAEGENDGSVMLRTQSVDNSNERAFAAAMRGNDISEMTNLYDREMRQLHDNDFYCGRRYTDQLNMDNAWSTIIQHRDLIEDFYFAQIEALARKDLPLPDMEQAKKNLTYGVWAALRYRLDENVIVRGEYTDGDLAFEVSQAYSQAAASGDVLLACGGSIAGSKNLISAEAKDVFEALFGKRMTCPFCGDKNQYGDPCSTSKICKACRAEVRGGKVIHKGSSNKQSQKKPNYSTGWLDASLESVIHDWQRIKEETASKQEQRKVRAKT